MLKKSYFLGIILFFFFFSCKKNPLDIDPKGVKVDISFIDIDSILFYADSETLIKKHQFYSNQEFYDYLIGYVLRIGKVHDTAFYNSIQLFRADTSIQKLESSIRKVIPHLKDKEPKIVEGFKRLKYHFSKGKIPKKMVYANSLFTNAVFSTEEDIVVGVDWYIGDTSYIVRQLNPQFFFEWMKKAMKLEFYERDVVNSWVITYYIPEKTESGTLADEMIRWGKILYLVEAAFPKMEKHLLLRQSKEKLDWMIENEAFFWKYLVKEKLLFSKDEKVIQNMLKEGPFTPGLPNQEAPDRYGQYLGWMMVHDYIEKTGKSPKELLETNYEEILQAYEIKE